MKKATFLILALLITSYSYSQKSEGNVKYYKSAENKIHTEQGYSDLKKKIISEFEKVNQPIKISKFFVEIEQKGDSTIQNYSFKILPLAANGEAKKGGADHNFVKT